ncbi:TRAP transporter large permease [Sphaerochaeta halotolerans]|jgi:tripartite ATP-independent transporter DctM subunit|uniref:TRAP transporter large permease n=1 Tax=Sphaerochaeta halotolerans TaxID=2293840 RepID=UPI001370DDAF|nr:TRAP transporter large permease [Sphaerochaeta halotolerans]MXI87542.1 TRAP transporter large permease subunit [Sphaerochaeta halotolerans]
MGIIAVVFILALAIGIPIAFVLGISSLYYFLFLGNIPLSMIGQKMYSGIDNYILLAIPFFILAGELMNRSKITDALISFADILVGRIPGALAQVNIVASVFFAGITGSGVADTAALGSILIPAMEKEGYTPEYATAVTVASSVIGPIIPPSVVMVIYSMATGESVGALFAAGYLPGILVAFSLMVLSFYYAKKNNHPRRTHKIPMKEVVYTLKESIIGLMCPVILVIGIFSGYFTPTEAAVIACLYAIIAGLFLLRTMNLKEVFDSFLSAAVTSSVTLLVIALANLFGQVLAIERIPSLIANFMLNLTSNKIVFLLMVNVFLLFMGMIMDPGASVLILAPIFLPIALTYGIQPLHFAIVMLVNLNLGLITPPVGTCLYAAAPIAKLSIEKISKAVLPFIGVELIALMFLTYVPELTLIVPRLLGYIY